MMLRGEKEREELQNELDKTRTNLRYGFIEPQVISLRFRLKFGTKRARMKESACPRKSRRTDDSGLIFNGGKILDKLYKFSILFPQRVSEQADEGEARSNPGSRRTASCCDGETAQVRTTTRSHLVRV